MCRWFSAFDHTIFSRWLPVHVIYLVMWLSVYSGIFVVQWSIHQFSLAAKYQSHEHINQQLQSGGCGLAEF